MTSDLASVVSQADGPAAAGIGQCVGLKREKHGPVEGTAVLWHDKEGWGAVALPVVDGEIWVHFSDLIMEGYRTLGPGQRVSVKYETPSQDGIPIEPFR